MTFIKNNLINKNYYSYLAESYRIRGEKNPRTRIIQYLGPTGVSATRKKVRYYEHMRPQDVKEKVPSAKEGWSAEAKADGSRFYVYVRKHPKSLAFINRRDVNATEKFPEFWNLPDKLKFKSTAVLDGEVVYTPPKFKYGSFRHLAMREHLKFKEDIMKKSKTIPLTYYTFDIVEKDEEPLIHLPLKERRKILDKVIPDNLKNVKQIKYTFKFDKLARDVKKHSGEGIVFKHVDSPYEEGKKSKWWLKRKTKHVNDVVAIAYQKGTGKREKYFGSILMAVWDKDHWNYVGKVGTGFDEKELKRLAKKMTKIKSKKMPKIEDIPSNVKSKSIFLKPKIVFRTEFTQLTKDQRYREPVYKGERTDLPPLATHKIGRIK